MRTANPPVRAGYTLMEMLVVLTIIVIAAAIAVPVIRSMLTDGRVAAAGDQVRAQLAETRARAMDEGRPWRLAYIPGTGVYQLAPEESSEWGQTAQDPNEMIDFVRDVLPQDVVFAASEQDIAGRQEPGPAGGTWETIAVYLPAGNARDDTITFFGQMGILPMYARVRALTGAVDVQQVMTPGEVQP